MNKTSNGKSKRGSDASSKHPWRNDLYRAAPKIDVLIQERQYTRWKVGRVKPTTKSEEWSVTFHRWMVAETERLVPTCLRRSRTWCQQSRDCGHAVLCRPKIVRHNRRSTGVQVVGMKMEAEVEDLLCCSFPRLLIRLAYRNEARR